MRILVLALSFLTVAFSAQAETKIAVVDTQAVIAQTNAAERAREILKIETEEAQKNIDKLEKELKKKQDDLMNKKSVLSEDKFKEEEDKLKKAVRDYRMEVRASQEGLDRRNLELRKPIVDAVREVIIDIAKKEGYTAILPTKLVVFHETEIDLTEEVLKRTNKKLDK